MNILYLCSDSGIPILGRKGASVHVRSLVSALTDAGHSVAIAAPLLGGDATAAAIAADVLHVPPGAGTRQAMDELRAYADRMGVATNVGSELRRILYDQQIAEEIPARLASRPDFIYERATVFGTAGVRLARRYDVPLVVELNAPLGIEQAAYRGTSFAAFARAAEQLTLSSADLIVTVSDPLREYVVEQGISRSRVRVMPNGIDPSVFAPAPASSEIRARWGIGQGPVLGFVGGLRPWHGVRVLPALVEELATRHPALQLVVAGDGPLRNELMDALVEGDLADRVVFTGAIDHDDIPDLVRTFDVALAPYDRSEHLFYFSPLKLFEYMACGVAVVAAAIGQLASVIHDDEDGLLYGPGDFDGLVRACDRLLADPALRQRLGTTAAAVVRSRYTWARNAAEVVAFVQRLRAVSGAA